MGSHVEAADDGCRHQALLQTQGGEDGQTLQLLLPKGLQELEDLLHVLLERLLQVLVAAEQLHHNLRAVTHAMQRPSTEVDQTPYIADAPPPPPQCDPGSGRGLP